MGQILPAVFCMACNLTVIFPFLNDWKKTQKKSNTSWHENYEKANFSVINKVLLGHSMAHSFISSYGRFCATGLAELSSYDRDYVAHKAWNIYYL